MRKGTACVGTNASLPSLTLYNLVFFGIYLNLFYFISTIAFIPGHRSVSNIHIHISIPHGFRFRSFYDFPLRPLEEHHVFDLLNLFSHAAAIPTENDDCITDASGVATIIFADLRGAYLRGMGWH